MLLNLSIKEVKLIRQAIEAFATESFWDEAEDYAPILEKLDKEIDYYDIATQED